MVIIPRELQPISGGNVKNGHQFNYPKQQPRELPPQRLRVIEDAQRLLRIVFFDHLRSVRPHTGKLRCEGIRCNGKRGSLAITKVQATNRSRTSAMRSPARPSHNGGTVPCFPFPSRILDNSVRSFLISWPTRTLVPTSAVTGRSVFCRMVRHGTRR